MKVLYAIQGTGNGHVSRARQIIPILHKHCELEVALSGHQSQVDLGTQFHHHLDGLTFTFGQQGGIDYWESIKTASFRRFIKEVRKFPINKYDLILNDFEPVTAWAAWLAGTPCVGFGHQASFLSPATPRPKQKSLIYESIMKNFAPCHEAVGFHFRRYDTFIHTPVIREEIRRLSPTNQGHYTVYLPAYNPEILADLFTGLDQVSWEIFSPHVKAHKTTKNVTLRPINNENYLKSLEACTGLITGGGFESPAEALFLRKKVLVIPMLGQYEQQSNARALQMLGVPVIPRMNLAFIKEIMEWVLSGEHPLLPDPYHDETETLLVNTLDKSRKMKFDRVDHNSIKLN